MRKKKYELSFHGRKIVVEHGEYAKQADGAVLVRYNDTVVLTAAVVSKNVNLLSDFFPLTVTFEENVFVFVGSSILYTTSHNVKAKITAKILNPKLFVRDLRILFFIL